MSRGLTFAGNSCVPAHPVLNVSGDLIVVGRPQSNLPHGLRSVRDVPIAPSTNRYALYFNSGPKNSRELCSDTLRPMLVP